MSLGKSFPHCSERYDHSLTPKMFSLASNCLLFWLSAPASFERHTGLSSTLTSGFGPSPLDAKAVKKGVNTLYHSARRRSVRLMNYEKSRERTHYCFAVEAIEPNLAAIPFF